MMLQHQNFRHLLILVGLIGFSFYYALGIYGFANNNEGLYAEIAREMYQSHHYVIATLNGVPYIEKPPLLYWFISACFHLWGINEFAARFVPATSGALICLALVFFAQQLNRLKEGMLAALILCTSLGFIFISRIVFFDMLLTALFSFSLMSFYLAWYFGSSESMAKCKWYIRGGYSFLALAMLAKGMLALVLIFLIGLAFLLFTKTLKQNIKYFLDPIGILIFLLIVLPWHVLAIIQHPGFFQDFFVNEQFLRFLDQRIPKDYYEGPIYYYLPRVIAYLLPWGIFLPLLALKKYRENSFKDPLKLFAWLWFLIPLIFLSLSKAKANYYMVVSCPALALLLAQAIYSDLINQRLIKFWTSVVVIFSLLSVSSVAIASHLAKKYEERFTLKPLAQLLLATDSHIQEKPIFFFQNFERISSLRFYLNQPVTMIDSRSKDLWYGSVFVKKLFITDQEFVKAIKNKNFYVVVRGRELSKFYKRMLPSRFNINSVVAGWVVLTNK